MYPLYRHYSQISLVLHSIPLILQPINPINQSIPPPSKSTIRLELGKLE